MIYCRAESAINEGDIETSNEVHRYYTSDIPSKGSGLKIRGFGLAWGHQKFDRACQIH